MTSNSKKLKDDFNVSAPPPHSIEIEEYVLSYILMIENSYHSLKARVFSELFYKPENMYLFDAIKTIGDSHKPIDPITIMAELKRIKKLEMVGGAWFVSKISGRFTESNIGIDYAISILWDKYNYRIVIRNAYNDIKLCLEESESSKSIISNSISFFNKTLDNANVEKIQSTDDVFEKMKEQSIEAKNKGGVVGIPTHLWELNEAICGFQKGFVYVIAARPGVGKTSSMKSILLNMALNKVKVKVFSLEMTAVQLMTAFVSECVEIDNQKFQKGEISSEDWYKIETLRSNLTQYIEIDDKPGITVQYLEMQIRKFVQNGGEIVAIDYLQLMKLTKEDIKDKNREQQVSFLTGEIKRIAKTYSIPIIELSQLNRSSENRGTDKRPQLSDLRESGSIEQDAEVIILIHRPEVHGIFEDSKGNNLRGLAKLIIAKNRFGPLTDVKVKYINYLTKFDNLNDKVVIDDQMEIFNAEDDLKF